MKLIIYPFKMISFDIFFYLYSTKKFTKFNNPHRLIFYFNFKKFQLKIYFINFIYLYEGLKIVIYINRINGNTY